MPLYDHVVSAHITSIISDDKFSLHSNAKNWTYFEFKHKKIIFVFIQDFFTKDWYIVKYCSEDIVYSSVF